MSESPRVAPGTRADVGTVNWIFAVISGWVTRTSAPNLFLILGRQRRLFRGWLHFAGRLMPGGTLPRRESELVILRVAHLTGCRYEQEHHRRLAARAGLSPAEVDRIAEDPDGDDWSARDRTLLTATDELHERRDLTDETWRSLRAHLDEPTVIEFVLLVAHYEMLATTITTLRMPLDQPRRRTRAA